MATSTNNPQTVSTVKGIKGGYMFVAPFGTTLPTDYSTALDPAFENVGYISSDGWSEAVDSDTSDAITDVNGDTVIAPERTSTTETLAFKLISITKNSMGVQYGSKNVTDADGTLLVKHNWGDASERLSVVLELVLKDNHRWRKVIPAGKVTELDDNTLSSTEVQGHQVTLSYDPDETGTGCYDYIQSYETTKANAAKKAN